MQGSLQSPRAIKRLAFEWHLHETPWSIKKTDVLASGWDALYNAWRLNLVYICRKAIGDASFPCMDSPIRSKVSVMLPDAARHRHQRKPKRQLVLFAALFPTP